MNTKKAQHVAAQCARLIMQEMGPEIARHGSPMKNAVISFLRRKLPPHGGRPRSRELDQAEEMKAKGWGLARIVAEMRPNFWGLPKAEQFALKEWLRRGLQQRRARKLRAALTAPTNGSDIERPAEARASQATIGHEDQDA